MATKKSNRRAIRKLGFHDREGTHWSIEQMENGTFRMNGHASNGEHTFTELDISVNRLKQIFDIYELGEIEFE